MIKINIQRQRSTINNSTSFDTMELRSQTGFAVMYDGLYYVMTVMHDGMITLQHNHGKTI